MRLKRRCIWKTFVFLIVSVVVVPGDYCAGEGRFPQLEDNTVLVTVDNAPITVGDYKEYLQIVDGIPLEKIDSASERKMKLVTLVNDLVLGKSAVEAGLDKGEEYRLRMSILETKVIPQVYVQREIVEKVTVTDDEIRKHVSPQPMRIRLQAFVSDNEAMASEALARARAGEDFGEIARSSSEGITSRKGGDIGYIALGTDDLFLKEEQENFRSLKKGEMSGVFKTRIGYMVVKATDVLTPEEQERRMMDKLRDPVKLGKERAVYDNLILRLRTDANARVEHGNIERIGDGKLEGLSPSEIQNLPVAWVRDTPVPYRTFDILGTTAFHSPGDLSLIVEKYLNSLLVAQEARRLGLDTSPVVRRQLAWFSDRTLARLALADATKDLKVTEKDYREYYDTHPKEFRIPASVRLSVVELKNEKRARESLKMLKSGTSFGDVVAKYSDDPALVKSGGDIGYYPVESLMPEIRDRLPKMKVGDTSPVIGKKGEGGEERYLIFRLTDRKPAGVAKFEQMKKPVVAPRIVAQKREKAIQAYMEKSIKAHPVVWNEPNVEKLSKLGEKGEGG